MPGCRRAPPLSTHTCSCTATFRFRRLAWLAARGSTAARSTVVQREPPDGARCPSMWPSHWPTPCRPRPSSTIPGVVGPPQGYPEMSCMRRARVVTRVHCRAARHVQYCIRVSPRTVHTNQPRVLVAWMAGQYCNRCSTPHRGVGSPLDSPRATVEDPARPPPKNACCL